MLNASYTISIVSDGIWPKFKLSHAFMYVLVTCKIKEDQMKNEGTRVVALYLRRLKAANSVDGCRVWPKIKLIQAFMIVLVTGKTEEDQIKNEWSQQISHYESGNFTDTQGQLTPQSEVGSVWSSNSSKLLWSPLLPARMKEWSKHYPSLLMTLKDS